MFKVESNLDDHIKELDSIQQTLVGKGVVAETLNTTPYAVYTEYGTKKMDAHAMIRSSAPAIEAQCNILARGINTIPTLARISEFAFDSQTIMVKQISSRTHVDTLRLIRSWENPAPRVYHRALSLTVVGWEYKTPKGKKRYA